MESFEWQENLFNVSEYIEPENNNGMPTAELIDCITMETLIDNVK